MKNLVILTIAIVSAFAACKSKTDNNKDVVGIDSTGLYKNNMMADTAQMPVVASGTTVKRVVETRNPDGTSTTTTTTITPKGASHTSPASGHSTANRSTGASTSSSTASTSTVRKKGWSNKAKGAVIGGVGGAVVGAAVSKKKGKGALIGGVVGAAGGYIIGNEKDKKKKP